MKKSIFIAALVVAAGLFVARPSSAQLSYGGNLSTVNGPLPSDVEGTFNVLATQSAPGSDVWNITVNWVSDGPDAPPTGAFLDQIQMRFNSGGTVNNGQITGGLDQVISLESGSVSGTNWVTSGSSPGQAEFEDPGTYALNPSPTAPVDAAESFTGSVTLSGLSSPISAAYFQINNSGAGQSWYGIAATPEGSSLALLLPGLIPLGLILRRRRKV